MIGGPVGNEQVDGEYESREARCEAEDQEDAAEELNACNEVCAGGGEWDVEAGEVRGEAGDGVHLAPAAGHELPAPVEPDRQ